MDWRTSLTMRRSGTAWSTSSGNRPRLTSPSSCGRSASSSAPRVGDLKRSLLRPPSPRVIPLVVLDTAVVYGGYAGALLLRFDADVPARSWTEFWQVTPFVAAAYVAANFIFGIYHSAWKYGGMRDLSRLAMVVISVTLIVFLVNLFGD